MLPVSVLEIFLRYNTSGKVILSPLALCVELARVATVQPASREEPVGI